MKVLRSVLVLRPFLKGFGFGFGQDGLGFGFGQDGLGFGFDHMRFWGPELGLKTERDK